MSYGFLGNEFKASCCPETGVMAALDTQKGKMIFYHELSPTAACTGSSL
jgi:hypothetical protein